MSESSVKNNFFIQIIIVPLIVFYLPARASDSLEFKSKLQLSAELRIRSEYRNGYRELRNDTTSAYFYTDQRSRMNFRYQNKKLRVYLSLQHVHIWRSGESISDQGKISIFESFIETSLTKNLSIRGGRQKIMYDNQRLFAQNDWRQSGRSHDALRIILHKKRTDSEFIMAFNDPKETSSAFSGSIYNPSFFNYKILLVKYFKYRFSNEKTFTLINAMDGFENRKNSLKTNYRFTGGGRIEYEKNTIYLTLAAYLQYGKTPLGIPLFSYYLQPEARIKFRDNYYLTIGSEVLSGTCQCDSSRISNSFDPLYGVNHRFLGSMDFFIRFPEDAANAGLIAPYVSLLKEFNRKIKLKSDVHFFLSHAQIYHSGKITSPFLAFENDLLLTYKINNYSELQLGYSFALLSESMRKIKGSGNNKLWHDWAFLMLSFKPEFLNYPK